MREEVLGDECLFEGGQSVHGYDMYYDIIEDIGLKGSILYTNFLVNGEGYRKILILDHFLLTLTTMGMSSLILRSSLSVLYDS